LRARKTVAQAAPPSRVAFGIRAAALFLLVTSGVMLPLATTAGLSIRLLALSLGVAGAFFWVLSTIFDGYVVLPRGRLAAAGLLALGAALVSGLFSDCPQAGIVTLLRWLAYAAVFLLALWVGASAVARHQVVRALCAGALPIALYGVLQYAAVLDLVRLQIESDKDKALAQVGATEQDYFALLQRTRSKRVFSTFALPNSLAGFLLILIPPAIALVVLARGPAARVVLGASVLAMLLGFFLTFSKGGWLAGALVLLLFFLTQGGRWLRRHWAAAAGVLVLGAVLAFAAVLSSPTLRGRLASMRRELAGSARVRAQYWAAGLRMWRTRPVLGVGPGNYANHYMTHKSVAAEEVKSAHNDYVQILAECGPVALVGYAGFWLLLLWGSLRRGVSRPPGSVPGGGFSAPSALVIVAALVGIAGADFFAAPWSITPEGYVRLATTGLFVALWWLVYRASEGVAVDSAAGRVIGVGLTFGVLGFVLHSFIDLDLFVAGVGYVAFIAAGLVAGPRLVRTMVRLEGRRQLAVLLAVTVAGLAVFWVVSRVSEADSYRVHGRGVVRGALTEPSGTGGLRRSLREARDALERSCRANPYDHVAWADLADCSQREFAVTGDISALERAIQAWQNAVRRNPAFPEYHAHLARLFRDVAATRGGLLGDQVDRYRRRAETLPLPSADPEVFAPALVESYLATACGPTKPQYRILFGEVLRLAGRGAEARKQWQTALALNRAMIKGRAPHRQRLTGEQVKDLQVKLGLTGSAGGAIIHK